ncbi:MAG: hypothetical protein ACLQVI_07545, partial [Polyangiaceae bacterium]
APLRERPWRSGIAAHGSAVVDGPGDLMFPDNVVKGARVAVSARRHFDPHDMESAVAVPASSYLEPLWGALRALGGEANSASATVQVRCVVEGGTDLPGATGTGKDGGARTKNAKPLS